MTDNAQPVFDSRCRVGERVVLRLAHVELPARVLAVAFLAGKVLYTLAVYTGHLEPDMASQYGLTNALGWEEDGTEYVRVPNIDSTFVEPTPDKIPVPILKRVTARLVNASKVEK